MGYLPSFRPTEILTTGTNKKVFGVNSDEFSNFFIVGSVDTFLSGNKNPRSGTTATSRAGGRPNTSGVHVGAANIETNTPGADVLCPRIYRPVCADGITYGNDCEATKAGKTNFIAGACQGVPNGAGNGNGGATGGSGGATGGSGEATGGSGEATGGGEGNINDIGIDPETGCMIAGFDEFGEPIFWGRDGNATDSPQNCLKDISFVGTKEKPLFNMEDIKANWHYLAITALAVLLLTKK